MLELFLCFSSSFNQPCIEGYFFYSLTIVSFVFVSSHSFVAFERRNSKFSIQRIKCEVKYKSGVFIFIEREYSQTNRHLSFGIFLQQEISYPVDRCSVRSNVWIPNFIFFFLKNIKKYVANILVTSKNMLGLYESILVRWYKNSEFGIDLRSHQGSHTKYDTRLRFNINILLFLM